LKNLEEENAALVNTNATLETELKKAGSAKNLADSYKAQIDALEARAADQANQVRQRLCRHDSGLLADC
jgi:protein HOOK3